MHAASLDLFMTKLQGCRLVVAPARCRLSDSGIFVNRSVVPRCLSMRVILTARCQACFHALYDIVCAFVT